MLNVNPHIHSNRKVLQIFKYCGRVDTYLNISVLRTTAPGKDRNPQQKIPRLSLFLTNSSQMTFVLKPSRSFN